MTHFEEDVEKTLLGLGLNVLISTALLANSLVVGACVSNWQNYC